MQPIAKNNCDFPSLRQSGCIYVDKTAWLHRLATAKGRKMFFLARPRRFGKPVWAVGLSFDGKTRQFKGGVAEAVKQSTTKTQRNQR